MSPHASSSPIILRAIAVLAPVGGCLALTPLRSHLANSDAALLLVLVVVAIAAAGDQIAGVLAALSVGVCFDFFLTAPYERLTISSRRDVETGALLLLVGLAVTQIAWWGRQQQAQAERRAGYLAGLHEASRLATEDRTPEGLIRRVGESIRLALGVTACRFDYGMSLGHPRLHTDGRVMVGAGEVDVAKDGLPADREIEVFIESGGSYRGRFLLQAPEGCHPTLEQRLVAVSLAEQVGGALTAYALRTPDV